MRLDQPLGLPPGTVRALIALSLTAAVEIGALMTLDDAHLSILTGLAGTAIGYYFAKAAPPSSS